MALFDYLKRTQYILVYKLLLCIVFLVSNLDLKLYFFLFGRCARQPRMPCGPCDATVSPWRWAKWMFVRRVQVSQSPSLLQTWKGYERKYGFIGDSWCPGDEQHWEPALKPFVSTRVTRVELVHHRNTCNDVPWCPQDSGIEHATRFTRCF